MCHYEGSQQATQSTTPTLLWEHEKGVWHNQLFQHQNPGLTNQIWDSLCNMQVAYIHTHQSTIHATRPLFPWRLSQCRYQGWALLYKPLHFEYKHLVQTQRESHQFAIAHFSILIQTSVYMHVDMENQWHLTYLDWFGHIRQNQHNEHWYTYLIQNYLVVLILIQPMLTVL